MQIKYRLLSLLAFAALAVCGVGGASAQGWHLSAVLVGGHETPAAGHPDGLRHGGSHLPRR